MKILNNAKVIIINFAARNFAFISILLFLSLTIFMLPISFGRIIHLYFYTTFLALCLAWVTDVIRPNKLRNCIRRLLIGIAVVVFIIDVFFLIYYHAIPNQAIIDALYATNKAEALEYARANLTNGWLYAALICILLVLYFVSRQLIKLKYNSRVIPIFAFWMVFSSIFTIVNIVKDTCKESESTMNNLKYRCFPLVRTCFYLSESYSNMEKLAVMLKNPPVSRILKNNSSIPYIVYILGESTSRHHMGIYGYNLNNTPYMSKREAEGDLLKFTDVISPNGQTLHVMEKLFTFYRQHERGKWYEYTDLFSILKTAGYYTMWLSNQESSGEWGNHGRVYAERCNMYAFTKLRNSSEVTIVEPYDAALLPLLDKVMAHPKAKNFIVLHLLGTHQRYRCRYPDTFKAYSVSEEQGESERAKEERANYDTAIRYNDSIMNEIIKRFENRDAIVIYTSDHGEDVMEINKNVAGHGEICINNRIIEIPMLVYMSKSFRSKRPKLAQRIKQCVDRPFVTDDMIHSILDIMEIKAEGYNPQLSVFNKQFNINRKRYCGKKLYKKSIVS